MASNASSIQPKAAATRVRRWAEVAWATLHGLATLTRRGRLPAGAEPARLDLLLE